MTLSSLQEIKRQLHEIAVCPIDFIALGTPAALQDAVREHWERFAEDSDVDLEGEYANPRLIDIDDDPESLIAGLHNWRVWGPAAKVLFREQVKPLIEMRALTRDEYPKHYPVTGWSEERIRTETLTRDSLLYPGMTPEYQIALLREPMASFFDEFLELAKVTRQFLYIWAEHPVGASRGQETEILCYDIHWSARSLHAYPVLDAERDHKDPTYASWLPA